MTKGGKLPERHENKGRKIGGHDLIKDKKKMKKNMQRLGGRGGLSLESFAKAKTRDNNYNPALIKKQREFYKNAKCVSKYKRSLKQQQQQNVPFKAGTPPEGETYTQEGDYVNRRNNKNKKSAKSLKELYEKKRDEEEKARLEREAVIQVKKEEREKSEARRRSLKEKMYKKTKSGQPVMKYRIEHLLDTIQGSTS